MGGRPAMPAWPTGQICFSGCPVSPADMGRPVPRAGDFFYLPCLVHSFKQAQLRCIRASISYSA